MLFLSEYGDKCITMDKEQKIGNNEKISKVKPTERDEERLQYYGKRE